MEEIEKLYNVLVDQGLFDKTLDEFKVKFEESAYVDRVYDAVVDQGLFDKTKEDFTEKYSLKKKIKKNNTAFNTKDGLSEQSVNVIEDVTTLPTRTPQEILDDPNVSDFEAQTYLGVEADKAQRKRDKDRPLDIITTATELQTYDFDQLLPYEQVKVEQLANKYKTTPEEWLKEVEAKRDDIADDSFLKAVGNTFQRGDKTLGEYLVSIPGTLYTAAATVTDPLFKAISGKESTPIEERVKIINEKLGVDTLLESLIKEQEYRGKKSEIYKRENEIEAGIVSNFRGGNTADGFKQLAFTLAESAPITLGIMMSSLSGVGLAKTATGATVAMTGGELRTQREENPEQSDFETLTKAVGLAAAEMVFTTFTSGSIGKVYKEIIFKEGVKTGSQTFKKGLVSMYESALKKYGPVTSSLGEGIEEVATQVTQNAINGRPLYEGVPDAFTAGVAGGAAYGSPIAINNGTALVNEAVAKTKINNILKPSEFNNMSTAFENPTIGDLQFDLSKVKRSDVILDKELKKRVASGEMTEEQAKEIKQNFFDTTVIDVKLDATKLTGEQKVQAANLLRERDGLKKEVNKIDDASLTSVQQKRISDIDSELTSLSKISITESVVGDTASINVAPLFDTTIETVEQAVELRQGEKYQQQMQTINDVLGDFGVTGTIEEAIGGYKNDAGTEIIEISNVIRLGEGTTREQADQIASMLGALAPETQESTIAADYVGETDATKNGDEHLLNVSDVQGTLEALKESGITDFTLNEQNNSLSLLNLDEVTETKEFLKKLGSLKRKLDAKGIQFEVTEARGINSRYITRGRRQEILSSLKESSIQQQLEGTSLYQKVEQAIARESETTTEETIEDDTTTDEVVEETIEAPQDEVQSLIETINDPSAGIVETVATGREQGFSDASIQKVLQGRGFKVRDIKPVLEEARTALEETMGVPLPAAFANIPGGIKVGQALFEEIKQELNKFEIKFSTDRKSVNEVVTKGEIREKALELLRESQVYQNLETIEQQELALALDKSIGTRANRKVQQEIRGIRGEIKKYREGVKDLKKAQAQVSKFVREVLPNEKDIKKFINSINKVTSKQDLPAVAEKIIRDVQGIRERQRQKLIKDIQKLARAKAKIRKTRSNKSRGGDISAQGKQFFQAVDKVLKTVLGGDLNAYDNMVRELNFTTKKDKEGKTETVSTVDRINDLTLKELAGDKLTQAESAFLDRMTAIELFADIEGKSLEEVQDLLNDLKLARSQAIADLNRIREIKAARAKKVQDEFNAEIKRNYPFLFDENGDLLEDSDLQQKALQTSIWKILDGKGVWKNLRQVYEKFQAFDAPRIMKTIKSNMLNIGTMSRQLDGNVEGGAFYNNFYDKVNVAEEKSLQGKFAQFDKLDEIAGSIEGIDNYIQIQKLFKPKQIEIKLEGKKLNYKLSLDNLARIYALSLNEQQAAMLEKDGFNAKKIEEIKNILGKEIVEFVDKTVDYLSTENYEKVNDTYKSVNDINLPRIENYFPTRTVRETPIDETSVQNMMRGEFSNVFNAETAPLLQRTNVKGKVNINPNQTFLNTLTNHLETTERYVAYAPVVETLNTIIKTPSVIRLMKDVMGMQDFFKRSVDTSINPNYGISQQLAKNSWLLTNFTGFALSFKAVQLAKQATSFVNAFEQYRYLNKTGSRSPLEFVSDLLGFAGDMMYVYLTLGKQMRETKEISASFRDRYEKGMGGDLYGLEAGGRMGKKSKKQQQYFIRKFKTGAASPTVFGDLLGVMGYKAVYNRNIANGMSQEEALKIFNDYNATQQSRRGTDKIELQRSNNALMRVFTMFLSTTFLQVNKTAQGMGGIMKDIAQIKRPKAKDLRAVSTNLFVANAMFTFTANFGKWAFGDEDDVSEVWRRVFMSPLNLIYSVPLLGGAAEAALNWTILGERRPSRTIINPYDEVFRRMVKQLDDTETLQEKAEAVLRPLLEITAGAPADPFIGLFNSFKGFEFKADDVYDALGVSPYYRPEEKASGGLDIPSSGGTRFTNPALKKAKQRLREPLQKFRKKIRDRLKRN